MKQLLVVALSFLFIGCDQFSSSFEMPEGERPQIQEKPKNCNVNFQKTCWPDTVREITSCLQENQGLDKFSLDKRHCFNNSGKFVEFHNAAQLFSSPFNSLSSYFFFTFSSDQINDCFQVEGTGSDVTIRVRGYEDTPIRIIRNQHMYSFSCLDGQRIVFDDPQKIDDCESKNGIESIPGVSFGPFYQNDVEAGWSFSFRGSNLTTGEIFRCHNP